MGLRDHAAKFETEAESSSTTTRNAAMSAPTTLNPKFPNKVTTGVIRIVYPNLAEPRPADAEIDAGKYTVLALIPKTDKTTIEAINAAVEYAETKKFPKGHPSKFTYPLKDGDEKFDKNGDPVEWYQGHYYLNLKSLNQPKLIDPCKQPIADPSFIKGGDWARVRIAFSGYEQSGNRGVGSYIDVLQFVRSGDPLGNSDTLDDFDDLGSGDDLAA